MELRLGFAWHTCCEACILKFRQQSSRKKLCLLTSCLIIFSLNKSSPRFFFLDFFFFTHRYISIRKRKWYSWLESVPDLCVHEVSIYWASNVISARGQTRYLTYSIMAAGLCHQYKGDIIWKASMDCGVTRPHSPLLVSGGQTGRLILGMSISNRQKVDEWALPLKCNPQGLESIWAVMQLNELTGWFLVFR